MTDEMLTQAINDAWNGMEHAQTLRDFSQTDAEMAIADSLYHAHWAAYYILIEMNRKRKKERMRKIIGVWKTDLSTPLCSAQDDKDGGQTASATDGDE